LSILNALKQKVMPELLKLSYTHLKELEARTPELKAQIRNKHFSFDQQTQKYSFVYLGNAPTLADYDKNLITELESVEFISPQPNLVFLDISYCSLKKIHIRHCPNLQYLYLNNNQLEEISFEGDFPFLQFINLDRNQLSQITLRPDAFPHLKHLYLHQNNLTDVAHLNAFFVQQPDFDLSISQNEKLLQPPSEVVKNGKESVRRFMLLKYAELAEKKAPKYQFDAKVLIIGEGETGKTTLLRKLKDAYAPMPAPGETTKGVDIVQWPFDLLPSWQVKLPDLTQKQMFVRCWDFGGQELYHGTHQIFFNENALYIMVIDTRKRDTDFNFWFHTIEQLAGNDIRFILVVNQKFGHSNHFNEDFFRQRFTWMKDVVYLDLNTENTESNKLSEAQKNANISAIMNLQDLVKSKLQALPGIGSPSLATYESNKEDLFKIKDNFISLEQYRNIAAKYGIKDKENLRDLSLYFTRIGVITHFADDALLSQRVYLNSDWLVKTLYKVLDDEYLKTEKKGRICKDDFSKIWKIEELDFEEDHLAQIMHQVGLMYHVEKTDEYVIPAHLEPKQPYPVWQFAENKDILRFRFKFDDYMPGGIMSRLIVALHQYIFNQKLVWKMGVNVTHENAYAEIIEWEKEFRVNLVGQARRQLLTIIREKMKEILQPYKKLNFTEEIPCNCSKCSTLLQGGHYHKYRRLQDFLQNNNLAIECPILQGPVSIAQILENVELPERKEGPKPEKEFVYHLKNIYLLLSNSFDENDLEQFCRFNPDFTEVLEKFGEKFSKQQKINVLIDFALRKMLMDSLLELMEKENPRQFVSHQPFKQEKKGTNLQDKEYVAAQAPEIQQILKEISEKLDRHHHESSVQMSQMQSQILLSFGEDIRSMMKSGIEKLSEEQSVLINQIMDNLNQQKPEINTMEAFVMFDNYFKKLITMLENSQLPNKEEIKTIMADPKGDISSKIKISIPILFSFVKYEAEYSIKTKPSWKNLITHFLEEK